MAYCWRENYTYGEEIINGPNIRRFQSFIVACTTKLLIKKSIDLSLRTRDDWDKYNRLKKTIDSGQVMDWALDQQKESDQSTPSLHKSECPPTLESMLLLDGEQKSILLNKIGDYWGAGV